MNIKKILLLILLLTAAEFSSAQVTVVADPAIDLLVKKHVKANSEGRGFRFFLIPETVHASVPMKNVRLLCQNILMFRLTLILIILTLLYALAISELSWKPANF